MPLDLGIAGRPPCPHKVVRDVFVKNIPRYMDENELKELFGSCGKIESLRLIRHPTGNMKGFAFIKYSNKGDGKNAMDSLNGYMIHPGLFLEVSPAITNKRLFVGNIPKIKGKDELLEVFLKITPEIKNLIIYPSLHNPRQKNRGFCFLEYENNSKASQGLKALLEHRPGRVFDCEYHADWADEEQTSDDETMSLVKIIYIRNLSPETTEDQLRAVAEIYGKIEKIKKIRNFAFVHYSTRKDAENALLALDGKKLGDTGIEVVWARPTTAKPKLEKILLIREVRTAQLILTENSPYIRNTTQNLNYGHNSHRNSQYNLADSNCQIDDLVSWRNNNNMNPSFIELGNETETENISVIPISAPIPQFQDNSNPQTKLEKIINNVQPAKSTISGTQDDDQEQKNPDDFIEEPLVGFPFFVPKKFQTMSYQVKRRLKTLESNTTN